MADTRAVLKPGDLVRFDGDEHLVTGLAGTSVRLRSESGNNQVVLAGYLMAAPDFAVLDATELPALEPFGLLESLPANVVADAQRWREHLVEVETGLPPDSGPGVTPRAGAPRGTFIARALGEWGVDHDLFKSRTGTAKGSPKPGDWTIYGPPDGRTGGHVDVVTAVHPDGTLTVVGGNVNNKVTKRVIDPDTARSGADNVLISGYVSPPGA